VDEIMKVMKDNNQIAQRLLKYAIPKLIESPIQFHSENEVGIMTPRERMSDAAKEMVEVLIR